MNAKLSKVNQSIEKTIQIVEVMARGKGPMRLQDVAKKCGMPASTVMRMLNTLQVYGYVNQDPCTQHYSLSLRFARLGCLVSEQTNMRDVARPFLAELAQRCQETVCLGCEAEMEVECTDVVDGPDGILMVSQRVGARAPLHATGAGKLLLLNYSNQKLNEYIAVKGLRALTPHTLVTREALVNSLETIRSRGYALEDEERELGARCVAAPVRDYSGRIVGGISVSGPTTRMSRARLEALAPLVIWIWQRNSPAGWPMRSGLRKGIDFPGRAVYDGSTVEYRTPAFVAFTRPRLSGRDTYSCSAEQGNQVKFLNTAQFRSVRMGT